MRIGVITGSGSYDWPHLEEAAQRTLVTEFGEVTVTEGRLKGVGVVQLSRHGAGHRRLSHQVDHKANLAALRAANVDAVISLTVCGAVDPAVAPGSLIVFDDLYFPSNRLPDGTPCTWFDAPGRGAPPCSSGAESLGEGRGHWIFDRPFSEPLRRSLIAACRETRVPVVEQGVYGQVDGPRFNSRAEIAVLGAAGVTAVSQTAGPEVVLAGEAELPLAVVGFVTDHANGVAPEPESVDALLARMEASKQIFADLVAHAVSGLAASGAGGVPSPTGFVYRFGS